MSSTEQCMSYIYKQCKEIKENNRMGKTSNLFKKIRDTKGTFHAQMYTIRDRNGMDLSEAEDIKKRWQENRRTIQKKIFMSYIYISIKIITALH